MTLTGVVFGMQATAVKPPATADADSERVRWRNINGRHANKRAEPGGRSKYSKPCRQAHRSLRADPIFSVLDTAAWWDRLTELATTGHEKTS